MLVLINPVGRCGFEIEISFPREINYRFARAISNMTVYSTRRDNQEEGWIKLINPDTRRYPTIERMVEALAKVECFDYLISDRILNIRATCEENA